MIDHTKDIALLEAALAQAKTEQPTSPIAQKAVADLIQQTERRIAWLKAESDPE